MADFTLEQQKAIAIAQAKRARAQAEQSPPEEPAQEPVMGVPGLAGLAGGTRALTRGLTAGLSDYVDAGARYALGKISGDGGSYNDALKAQRADVTAFRESNPVAAYGNEIAGGIASPVFKNASSVADEAVNAATRFSPKLAQSIAENGAGRFLAYGARGAASGGIAGLGNAEGQGGGIPTFGDAAKSTSIGTAGGAFMGAAIPAAAQGISSLIGKTSEAIAKQAPAMTREQIQQASRAAYKASEEAGVVVKPEAFTAFVNSLPYKLEGFHPKVAEKTNAVLKALEESAATGQPVTLQTLDQLRQVASGAAKTMDRNEVRLISSIVEHMDDFIDDLGPDRLITGNADKAVSALKEARGLWRTNAKLRNIDDIVEIGETLNDPNWVKNQFRAIVRKPRLFNQYTEDERAIIKNIARTGIMEGLAKMQPLRGVQMAAPHIAQVGQDRNTAALQNLIARGGVNPKRPPTPVPPQSLLFGARAPGAVMSPFMVGRSNQ